VVLGRSNDRADPDLADAVAQGKITVISCGPKRSVIKIILEELSSRMKCGTEMYITISCIYLLPGLDENLKNAMHGTMPFDTPSVLIAISE
jgi:hypothetical protein